MVHILWPGIMIPFNTHPYIRTTTDTLHIGVGESIIFPWCKYNGIGWYDHFCTQCIGSNEFSILCMNKMLTSGFNFWRIKHNLAFKIVHNSCSILKYVQILHIIRFYCVIIYVGHFWPPNYCSISLQCLILHTNPWFLRQNPWFFTPISLFLASTVPATYVLKSL